MPDSIKPHLTVIPGGKVTPREFIPLPAAEKLALLRSLPARQRVELLLADPRAHGLIRAFKPQELYWIIKEVGVSDALELLAISTPEQKVFCLDMELWEKWSFSEAKAMEWLDYLVAEEEQAVAELLPTIDYELLLLILLKTISVGGGIGELASDEERLADWDHSFDNLYFITFTKPEHARLIGRLLDIIHRRDQPLYFALMEGVRNEMASEMEDICYQFRSGRLADLGFPELRDAMAIYAYLDPATFVAGRDKALLQALDDQASLLPAPPLMGSLLQRVLARADSEELRLELNYLINNALVAEDAAFSDVEAMQAVFQRVYGYLNIALEFLCSGDEARAQELVAGEYLRRLFQLGASILINLQNRASRLTSTDYPTGKALTGLQARRPRFYRGLDPDNVDGYREFRDMADVRQADEFLHRLAGE